MKKQKIKYLLTAILLSLSINIQAASSPPPPPMAQPMPSTVGAKWLILANNQYNESLSYEDGLVQSCVKEVYSKLKCSKKLTPQEIISKKMGDQYVVIGISPLVDHRGQEMGIVIYYNSK